MKDAEITIATFTDAIDSTGTIATPRDDNCPDYNFLEYAVLIRTGDWSAAAAYCQQRGWIDGDPTAIQAWFTALGQDMPYTLRGGIHRSQKQSEATA